MKLLDIIEESTTAGGIAAVVTPLGGVQRRNPAVGRGVYEYANSVKKRKPKKLRENEEYRDEAGMAKTNLHTAMRAVRDLHNSIADGEDLPEWVQEKIATVKRELVTISDYMLSQHEQGIRPMQNMSENKSSGWSVRSLSPDDSSWGISRVVKTAAGKSKSETHPKKFRSREAAEAEAKKLNSQASVAEGSSKQPRWGYHIVDQETGNSVPNTPKFKTRQEAQQYLKTHLASRRSELEVDEFQMKEGVSEGHADQQRQIIKKAGKPVGEIGIDRESSPGAGMYYMKHYASGLDLGGYDSREEAMDELRYAIKQGVAEGYDDPQLQRVKFRGTNHDIGEERYLFSVNGNPLVFIFASDEDNPDPNSPSFKEILARVKRDGDVEHLQVTDDEQLLIAKKIEDARRKYLKRRQQEVSKGEYMGAFKTEEEARKHAKKTAKELKDNLDGIEVWKMRDGSFQTLHTLNNETKREVERRGGKRISIEWK